MAADALMYAGLALVEAGIWFLCGTGWACLAGGTLLFISGGLAASRSRR